MLGYQGQEISIRNALSRYPNPSQPCGKTLTLNSHLALFRTAVFVSPMPLISAQAAATTYFQEPPLVSQIWAGNMYLLLLSPCPQNQSRRGSIL